MKKKKPIRKKVDPDKELRKRIVSMNRVSYQTLNYLGTKGINA